MTLEIDPTTLADALPGFMCLAHPDGGVEFVNRRWLDYAGVDRQEASSGGWGALAHPDDLLPLADHWRRSLDSGESGKFDIRLRRRDGGYRLFRMSSSPVLDESGHLLRWCGLALDTSGDGPSVSNAVMEEEPAPAQLDLRSIVDTIPMTAWSTEPDGCCDFVNQRWLDYAGLSPKDALGWGWASAVHPEDLPDLDAEWKSCLASGRPMNAEARMRRFDGVYRWFLFLGNPLCDADGKIVKWFGTNVDVEARRRAEDALRASERSLIQIINTIPTTAWSTRPDGYCDFLSDRWLDYAGFTSDEAVGWNWSSVIHPEDAPALIDYWQKCLATGTPVDFEARMRRSDGVYRWFLFRANPFRDAAGTIVKWYGTNVDIEDRKKADEALLASQRNLNQIINTIPTTAWSTRPDGYCDFLSDRWLDYAGFTSDEAIGWSWSSVIHPEDAPALIDYWQGCLETGTPVDVEARMRRFDGVYRWFLFRANPLRDATGTIVKWYGTNVDIEDRKKADQALRASERNLSLIINTIPMLAWSTRPDGFCDFVNQRWIAFTGISAQQARGWSWEEAIHPEDVKGLVAHWQHALATGQSLDTEARMRRFDGEYRWFLFRGNPLHDESGNLLRWYGTNVDIEDRKRAEGKLRRSELLLAEGQRISQTGSFYWQVDAGDILGSEELYRILGLSAGSPITLDRVAERVHPEDLQLLDDLVAQARAGRVELHYELRLSLADGSFGFLRINASRSQDHDGRVDYVGAIQDVTDRRRSEQVLAEVRSELAYMTRVASMGVLTASIAHEVNQPLTGIIANGSACLRMLSADPPNVGGALETVRRTIRDSNRAADVITRLRALFAKRHTATEPVDLNEATREVIALSISELQRNRVTLRTELAESLDLILGDRIQLQQVILNLLVNASTAMSSIDDRPRVLVIKTGRDGGQKVRFSIQDNGVGIAAEHIDRLFDPFYTTKSNGLGIGLSVSRTIVEGHQGRLWGAPNEGAGATFCFSIPSLRRP